MTPWNPPPPVPRNRPFQVLLSGSHTSILMAESEVGVSVAVTRQNAGNPVSVCGGLEPGTTNTPLMLSVAELIVVCSSCNDCRLVHGVALADVLDIVSATTKPMPTPTRWGRSIVSPP